MSGYRHTQRGGLAMVFAALAFVMLIVFLAGAAPPLAIVVTLIFTLWLGQFTSLTVSIDDERVRASLGMGLLHRTIPIEEIVEARAVRNPWYYGWGVRLYPGGWMFNVGGFDAVELSLRSGRMFRIGTDEPGELLAAVDDARRATLEEPAATS